MTVLNGYPALLSWNRYLRLITEVKNGSKRQPMSAKIVKEHQTTPRYFRELYSNLAGREGEMRIPSFPRVSQRKKQRTYEAFDGS
jgi:hypothetical protein